MKYRLDGEGEPRIIGGFLEKSWNSENGWPSSKEDEQSCSSGESPILESQLANAFDGPNSCSNAIVLRSGNNGDGFHVEEVEVFQVQ